MPVGAAAGHVLCVSGHQQAHSMCSPLEIESKKTLPSRSRYVVPHPYSSLAPGSDGDLRFIKFMVTS